MKKRILSILLAVLMLVSLLPVTALATPAPDDFSNYCLCGYINNADYGMSETTTPKWNEPGDYVFDSSGKLTATFTEDSYVEVRTKDGSSWYAFQSFVNDGTTTRLYAANDSYKEKMYVPKGTSYTFTLSKDGDGYFRLGYEEAANDVPVAVTSVNVNWTSPAAGTTVNELLASLTDYLTYTDSANKGTIVSDWFIVADLEAGEVLEDTDALESEKTYAVSFVCTLPEGYYYDNEVKYDDTEGKYYFDSTEKLTVTPSGFDSIYSQKLGKKGEANVNKDFISSPPKTRADTIEIAGMFTIGAAASATYHDVGKGTAAEPWEISTLAQLNDLAAAVNGTAPYAAASDMTDKYFKLTADIGTTEKPFTTPIGNNTNQFKGNFDGDGHTVTLDINLPDGDNVGLFGYCLNAVISNLTTAGKVAGKTEVGGICGYAPGTAIAGCVNNATVTATEYEAGGICGNFTWFAGRIVNCINNGAITGGSIAGGICGSLSGHVVLKEYTPEVDEYGYIENCLNTGKVTATNSMAGGICGDNMEGGRLINCVNIGEVSTDTQAGAIAGFNLCEIKNCYAKEGTADNLVGGSGSGATAPVDTAFLSDVNMKATTGQDALLTKLNGYKDPATGTYPTGWLEWTVKSGEYPTFKAAHTHDGVTFATPIANEDDLLTLFAEGGSGYLTADIAMEIGSVDITNDVSLCLNGHALILPKGYFGISTGGTFTLYDCNERASETSFTHEGYVDENGLWHLSTDTSIGTRTDITGGLLTKNTESAVVVYVGGGSFVLNGGTICGGSDGGVHVDADSSFIMNGGTITGNTSTAVGGVDVSEGTFEMNGGNICGNTAYNSGVSVSGSGKFTMNDGNIFDNVCIAASICAGGVFVLDEGSIFTMNGGNIYGLEFPAVCNMGATFVMLGGSIRENSCSVGAIVNMGGTFIVGKDAVISSNTDYAGNAKNVVLRLDNEESITVATGSDAPTDGMKIGVTLMKWDDAADDTVPCAGRFTATPTDASAADFFFPDDPENYEVKYNAADGGYLELAVPAHTHDGVTFEPWDSDNSLPAKCGNWYLTKDVTLTKTWDAPASTTNLCLNGHVIRQTGGCSVMTGGGGDKHILNIYDCDQATNHEGYLDKDGLWHLGTLTDYAAASATKTDITGGIITGGSGGGSGGGFLYTNGGIVTLYGGTICGNLCSSGLGGAVSTGSGSFAMYGGAIRYNRAQDGAGGIYTFYNGKLILGGNALICDNTSEYFGKDDVRSANSGTITLASGANGPKAGMQVGLAGDLIRVYGATKAEDANYFFCDDNTKTLGYNSTEGCLEYVMDPVSYVVRDAEGNETPATCTNYIVVDASIESFSRDLWYVVNKDTTINAEIRSIANLILCDGCTLTAKKGINVYSDETLNIYGQSGDTGTLIATGANGRAGIGSFEPLTANGTVNIHGGIIQATGNEIGGASAGIGGCNDRSDGSGGGTVNIYGGTVTAEGKGGVAGIGGGAGGAAANVTIGKRLAVMNITSGEPGTKVTMSGTWGATLNGIQKVRVELDNSHAHDFTYSATDNVLTATCKATDCDLHATPTTLTLTTPTNLVYDNTAKEVTFANGEESAWTAAGCATPSDIVYYLEDGTTKTTTANSGAEDDGKAPVNVGSYVAKVTVDTDKTATLAFTIASSTLTPHSVSGQMAGGFGSVTPTINGSSVTQAEAGASVVFTAIPLNGYEFAYWEVIKGGVNIEAVKTNRSITVIMPDADLTLTAHFKAVESDDDDHDWDYEKLVKAGMVAAGVVTTVVVTKIVVDRVHAIKTAYDAAAAVTPEITVEEMPMVAIGDSGDAVTTLQTKLNELGYNCGEADGVFGQNTLNAVKAFQTAKGLTADGVVGEQTWGALL